jgi:hypothetical protein
VLEQLPCREIGWLPPVEDRLSDIRREIAEADETSEIGPAYPFPVGECGKRNAFALGECRVEAVPLLRGGEMDAPCPPSLAWIEPRSAWVRRA